jgi:hypothetical protein
MKLRRRLGYGVETKLAVAACRLYGPIFGSCKDDTLILFLSILSIIENTQFGAKLRLPPSLETLVHNAGIHWLSDARVFTFHLVEQNKRGACARQ